MIGRDRHEFFIGHVPELGLAEEGRRAADRAQEFAVGRESDRLDPLRPSDQAGHTARAVRLVQQDLVEPGDGQQRTVRGIGQGRDDGRAGILGRILSRHRILHAGRRVVFRSLANPFADELDLKRLQRLAVLGHLRLARRRCIGRRGCRRAFRRRMRRTVLRRPLSARRTTSAAAFRPVWPADGSRCTTAARSGGLADRN